MKATITNRRGNPCPPNDAGPPPKSPARQRHDAFMAEVEAELAKPKMFEREPVRTDVKPIQEDEQNKAIDELMVLLSGLKEVRPEASAPSVEIRKGGDVDLEARRERYLANLEREHQARIKEENRRRAEALESAQEALENSKWKNVPVRLWRAWRDIFKEVLG